MLLSIRYKIYFVTSYVYKDKAMLVHNIITTPCEVIQLAVKEKQSRLMIHNSSDIQTLGSVSNTRSISISLQRK
jgi:hypothetical protein